MSRTEEENMLLDQRIQMMKQKSEELRRRHMEVEADKQSAAKQNALVQMNSPHDDEWIPGRHISPVRNDTRQRRAGEDLFDSFPRNRPGRGRGNRPDQRRSWNEHGSDNSFNNDEGQRSLQTPNYNVVSAIRGRRPGYQSARHSEYDNGNEGNQARESPYFPTSDYPHVRTGHDGRQGDWASNGRNWSSNRGHRNEGLSNAGDIARQGNYSGGPTVTSKVFKNSSIETDHSRESRGRRPVCRLAEGDGPPPDPSYSFLNDAMRDSSEGADNRRRQQSDRRGRASGRGRQSWNDRAPRGDHWGGRSVEGFNKNSSERDPRQQSYEAWRRQRNQIDQERINRQKTSDGNWSREWDSNKVLQEDTNDRPARWSRGERGGNRHPRGQRWGPEESVRTQPADVMVKEDHPVMQDISSDATQADVRRMDAGQQMRHDKRVRQRKPRENRYTEQAASNLDDKQQRSGQEQEKISLLHGNEDSSVVNEEIVPDTKTELPTPDESVTPTRRCVEGVGGTLRISLNSTSESVACESKSHRKNTCEGMGESKPHRKTPRKAKRTRVLSTASTATTSTQQSHDDEDGSWEDVSSGEEDVSVLTELQAHSKYDLSASKPSDLSSGPESLDPIPGQDEFLWEEFHPAGFQNNMTLAMETEAALKALLEKQAIEGNKSEVPSDVSEVVSNPTVTFKLDTACLEDSSDDCEGVKLDPLLVTTQIVQAEVDCMSLTSVATDVSLPDDILSAGKIKDEGEEDKIVEEEVTNPSLGKGQNSSMLSAEELSGPMSIVGMEAVPIEMSSSNTNESDHPSDSEKGSHDVRLHCKADGVENPEGGLEDNNSVVIPVPSKEIDENGGGSESQKSVEENCDTDAVCTEGEPNGTHEVSETLKSKEGLHLKESEIRSESEGASPDNTGTLNNKSECEMDNSGPIDAKPDVVKSSDPLNSESVSMKKNSELVNAKPDVVENSNSLNIKSESEKEICEPINSKPDLVDSSDQLNVESESVKENTEAVNVNPVVETEQTDAKGDQTEDVAQATSGIPISEEPQGGSGKKEEVTDQCSRM